MEKYADSIARSVAADVASIIEEEYRRRDNHLILVDLTNKGINGKQLRLALDRAEITANRNAIPFDTLSPALTSGLRLGTAAATTRGFGLDEMAKIADRIDRVAADVENDGAIAGVRAEITELCRAIPLYPDMY